MRPVNLLPESQRPRAAATDGGRRSYVVLGVLAVLAAMSAIYVFTANQATSRAEAAAEAAVEADRLEAEANTLGAFGNFAQVKETRVAAVRQLAGSRFDWERMMRELARVLPAKGWLQAVEASTGGAVGDGATVATGSPSMRVTGCLPRQPDVADLMLRLRRMHRVVEVDLTESTLEDERAAPTVDNCGRYYRFDVNATFAPAVAEEAPDGRRRVPVSLGGGS